MQEAEIDFTNTKYISEIEHGELIKRCSPKAGDILLTKIGTIGRAAVVPSDSPVFSLFVSVALLQTNEKVIPDYLCACLNTSFVRKQFERHLKGIGVPDLHLENIAETQIVVPDISVQKKLSKLYFYAFSSYKEKIQQANELLINFENQITKLFALENSGKRKTAFAIKFSQLDGVIDAKRYASQKASKASLKISDICEVLKSKINVTSFGADVIDWIRIDDLSNQPLDIEEIRTQPANEVTGSFFKVEENDILVARLGPTILNQKIVMVRSLNKVTIASAEFLVLRCKPEYNPEAVMAVLKTEYYKNLMYSHARGSTPSRYRLNREDIMELPFPEIKDKQKDLARQANEIRLQVKKMRIQAENDWQAAREQFEKDLLGE